VVQGAGGATAASQPILLPRLLYDCIFWLSLGLKRGSSSAFDGDKGLDAK
jgi:hypothetical protein